MKDSFVLYTDYIRQVDRLSDEQAGKLLKAILCYAAGRELPQMDDVSAMAFDFIQSRMERDFEQYQRTVDARRESGRRGGEARAKNFAKENIANEANAKFAKKNVANVHDNVLVPVPDNVLDKALKTSCPEPETAPARIAASFVLNDGSMYNVTENDVAQYQQLYPGIDCMQEIRKIVGWCDANPKNRKTRSGAKRFVNSWLSRAQDSARPTKPTLAPNRFHNFEQRDTDYDAIALQRVRERLKEGNDGSIG